MIDYQILANSIKYYEKHGYKRIEAPWTVTESINRITAPAYVQMYYVNKSGRTKCFVASGEQSFLSLINKGFLPAGKYQTITPCMRDDEFDIWHTKYFMKNELIITDLNNDIDEYMLDTVLDVAFLFFESQLPEESKQYLKKVKTDQGYDIEFNGIEIGSYGIRECEFVKWVYGTGVAEPRFSRVINVKK